MPLVQYGETLYTRTELHVVDASALPGWERSHGSMMLVVVGAVGVGAVVVGVIVGVVLIVAVVGVVAAVAVAVVVVAAATAAAVIVLLRKRRRRRRRRKVCVPALALLLRMPTSA